MMKRFLLAAALCFAFARTASAQDDQFQTLVDKGLDQYRARQYDEAVANFEAAYKLRQEPELLYNIARSYEKALRREQAIDAYKRFLELKGTTAELRANARSALDALEREKAAEESPSLAVPKEPRQPNAATRVETSQPAGRSHTLEYGMIGAGGAAVVVGVIFTVLAFQAHSDFDNAMTREDQERFQSSVKRNAAIADVLVIGGVVLGGAGVVLYLVNDDDGSNVALGPAFGGDSASFALSGTF